MKLRNMKSSGSRELHFVVVSKPFLGNFEHHQTTHTQRPHHGNTVRGAELIALTPRGYGAHVSELTDEEALALLQTPWRATALTIMFSFVKSFVKLVQVCSAACSPFSSGNLLTVDHSGRWKPKPSPFRAWKRSMPLLVDIGRRVCNSSPRQGQGSGSAPIPCGHRSVNSSVSENKSASEAGQLLECPGTGPEQGAVSCGAEHLCLPCPMDWGNEYLFMLQFGVQQFCHVDSWSLAGRWHCKSSSMKLPLPEGTQLHAAAITEHAEAGSPRIMKQAVK